MTKGTSTKIKRQSLPANNTMHASVKLQLKCSCLYLYKLGSVEQVSDKLKIPDSVPRSNNVYKYGRTDDLSRRDGEHKRTFRKFKIEIELYYAIHVQQSRLVTAEAKLKNYFKLLGMKYGTQEYVTFDNEQLDKIKKFYDKVYHMYDKVYQKNDEKVTSAVSQYLLAQAKIDLAEKNKEIEHFEETVESKAEMIKRKKELLDERNKVVSNSQKSIYFQMENLKLS